MSTTTSTWSAVGEQPIIRIASPVDRIRVASVQSLRIPTCLDRRERVEVKRSGRALAAPSALPDHRAEQYIVAVP